MLSIPLNRTSLLNTQRPLLALLVLRFGFFGLLAYDLWSISLSHAPRYGAGGFNVAHLDFLNLWFSPNPVTIGILYILAGTLSLWVAVGLLGRLATALCASIYTFSYFWSQADSYQHHYLLCLCLFLFVGMPWQKIKSINLNALMLQMSLIYAWTAVAKLEPVWLSGDTLNKLVVAPDVRATVLSAGAALGLNVQETFQFSAWTVIFGEFFAAVAFVVQPLRSLAFFIVPWFHIMVEWIGFDIELFSYYMLLLNFTLLSPHRFWTWLDNQYLKLIGSNTISLAHVDLSVRQSTTSQVCGTSQIGYQLKNHLVTKIAFALTIGLVSAWSIDQINLEGSSEAALITSLLLTCLIFTHLLFINLKLSKIRLLVVMSMILGSFGHYLLQKEVSSAAFRFDYYRMWGGDLKRRGQDLQALEVYQKANQAQAKHLPARFIPAGELAIKLGKQELGLQYLREGAQRRLLHLESKIQSLLEATPNNQKAYRNEFERAARSANQAQQKLYRAYLKTRDPRANEARYGVEMIQQMIQQTRAQL